MTKWEPPRYRVRAVADAILAELAQGSPQHSMIRETAMNLAIAAIKADRQALLNAPLGRPHHA